MSMEFPRQEYWSGLPRPSLGDLPNPGIEPVSPALASGFFTTEPLGKPEILLATATFPGGGKEPACNAGAAGDEGSIRGLGRSSGGGGHGNPLQCSCLENPMDRGAWWATVHRVAKSWHGRSDLACVRANCITDIYLHVCLCLLGEGCITCGCISFGWQRAWSMLHILNYLLKPLSALVPIQWYHSNVRMLPAVSLRLILAWIHLEHSGPGPQLSLLLLKAVSSQGLAVFPVWNLSGSLYLLMSNLGGRTWVSVPFLPINPRIFYAK